MCWLIRGASNIAELWPSLEVFSTVVLVFEPYREAYHELIPSNKMHYEEIYNASEGFFAIQDEPNEKGMLLMLDYGVFYEFIPLDALSDDEDALIDLSCPYLCGR